MHIYIHAYIHIFIYIVGWRTLVQCTFVAGFIPSNARACVRRSHGAFMIVHMSMYK